ncbi:RNA-directed DNA polymerase from mobile element jockey [Holothuria leucospilota]|uniref:RNA-directed DNA polymerase from mobile element jockey n=1 Tax=Holothuria leucospilota TaxID=206669 RepID=A0A9Q1HIC2_HOLLE|nr:RNA-directed DNA polymerase from mobile element jockey [Holothuria leucospilota]
MVFNNRCTYKFDISIDGRCLKLVNSVKFLGVYIDSKLSWSDHIFNTSSHIARAVGILGRLKYLLPRNVLRTIYLTLIYPHLTYCSGIWSTASHCQLNKLHILQKRAIRHITCSKPRDHTNDLFKSLNLLKLPDIIKLGIASFTYRSLNNILPDYFSDYFSHNSSIHDYNTRQSTFLHQDTIQTSSQHSSLRNRAIKLWNSLPYSITHTPSIQSFRRNFSRHFIGTY